MKRKVVVSLLAGIFIPILFGVLAAIYELALFITLHYNPELVPAHIHNAVLFISLIAALVVAWLISSTWITQAIKNDSSRLMLSRTYAVIFGVLALLSMPYTSARVLAIQTALIQKFGYCCCCEERPTLTETTNAIINPFWL